MSKKTANPEVNEFNPKVRMYVKGMPGRTDGTIWGDSVWNRLQRGEQIVEAPYVQNIVVFYDNDEHDEEAIEFTQQLGQIFFEIPRLELSNDYNGRNNGRDDRGVFIPSTPVGDERPRQRNVKVYRGVERTQRPTASILEIAKGAQHLLGN